MDAPVRGTVKKITIVSTKLPHIPRAAHNLPVGIITRISVNDGVELETLHHSSLPNLKTPHTHTHTHHTILTSFNLGHAHAPATLAPLSAPALRGEQLQQAATVRCHLAAPLDLGRPAGGRVLKAGATPSPLKTATVAKHLRDLLLPQPASSRLERALLLARVTRVNFCSTLRLCLVPHSRTTTDDAATTSTPSSHTRCLVVV